MRIGLLLAYLLFPFFVLALDSVYFDDNYNRVEIGKDNCECNCEYIYQEFELAPESL